MNNGYHGLAPFDSMLLGSMLLIMQPNQQSRAVQSLVQLVATLCRGCRQDMLQQQTSRASSEDGRDGRTPWGAHAAEMQQLKADLQAAQARLRDAGRTIVLPQVSCAQECSQSQQCLTPAVFPSHSQ